MEELPLGVACGALAYLSSSELLTARACSRLSAQRAAHESLWVDLEMRRRTTDRLAGVARRLAALGGEAAMLAVRGMDDESVVQYTHSFEAYKMARGGEAAEDLALARRKIQSARARATAAARDAATLERQFALDLAALRAPKVPPVMPPRRGRRKALGPTDLAFMARDDLLQCRLLNGAEAHVNVLNTLDRQQARTAAWEAKACEFARAATVLAPSLMKRNAHLLDAPDDLTDETSSDE